MVNLICQAHGLRLLIKDLLKNVGGVGSALEASIDISNFEGAHSWCRKLLQEKQKEIYGKIYQICSQVETRFGTKVMVCRDVLRSAKALQAAVMDAAYNHADEGAAKVRDHITDITFVMIDKMDACLEIDVWKDARKVLTRMIAPQLQGKVIIELSMLECGYLVAN
ncbi:hypothetical protein WJX77_010154 [Trebouxia sp. C0004]